jgi:predicted RNA-binding Zn-ribbon protein involved in translation (DUF1610 family)
MQMRTDDTTTLCETCGYVIEGMHASAPCPECGTLVGESLPDKRRGTPWQRRPGLFSWAATAWFTLRHSDRVFRELRVDSRGWKVLLAVNLVLAATTVVAPWVGVFAGDPVRTARNSGLGEYVAAAIVIPIEVLCVTGLLFTLTAIEARGIRFFGARRGWRITRAVSWQICSHASVGWIAMAALFFLGLAAAVPAFEILRRLNLAGRPTWLPMSVREALAIVLGGAGFLLGMLVFELLVYVGVRRCRFANPPRTPGTLPAPSPAAPIALAAEQPAP